MPNLEHWERILRDVPRWGGYANGGVYVSTWNKWRKDNPDIKVDLARAGLNNLNLRMVNLRGAYLNGANCVHTSFGQADFREANLCGAALVQACLIEADLRGADLNKANLFGADLRYANLSGATLRGANLSGAQLNYATLRDVNLTDADLSCATLVSTDLQGATLNNSRVYGVSAWNVNLKEAKQHQLIVTQEGEPTVKVDSLEVAQFVYLLLENANLRTILDTIGQKAVLILGRFGEGGIEVLHTIAEGLRESGYLPMIFEFARPADKTYTETVRTLAGLARFVVVDLSGPSVPQELYATIPHTKIPFVPILEKGMRPYSMFVDLLEYEWVLKPILEFESSNDLLLQLAERIIGPAETRVAIRLAKLRELFGS